MVIKTIKYKDPLTDEEVEEEFYFHLTAAELIEMGLGGTNASDRLGAIIKKLGQRAQRIEDGETEVEDLTDKDIPDIFQLIKAFAVNGYGVISENGRHKKSNELREEFAASEAYSSLIMELCTDAEKGAEFINGMVPSDLQEQVETLKDVQSKPNLSVVPKNVRKVTRSELNDLPSEDFIKLSKDLAEGRAELVDDPQPVS